MEDKIKNLMEWVNKKYSPTKCGWTMFRSEGNYADVFSDGMASGTSWAAYEIGSILGMDLEQPDDPDYDF